MNTVISLNNKNIMVVGSSYIGKETALLCGQVGAKIICVDDENLKFGYEHNKHYIFPYRKPEAIEQNIKQLISETGPIDGLVYIWNTDDFEEQRNSYVLQNIMEHYFYSFVEMIRCITKRDCFHPGLSIVAVPVISPIIENSQLGCMLSVAKASVQAAIRCIAKEMAPNGRANTVCFLPIKKDKTNNQETILDRFNEETDLYGITRQDINSAANMIAFLLSDAARLITGSNIIIKPGACLSRGEI